MSENKEYEAKIIIPTVQYGNITFTVKDTPEGVFEANRHFLELSKGAVGIPPKDMNTVIDKMLLGQTVEGGIELYEKMSDQQKYATQCLKRALSRIKSKEVIE